MTRQNDNSFNALVLVPIGLVPTVHPPPQEATVSRPWRNAGVRRSLGEGGLELRRVTPQHRCRGLLPVGLHWPPVFTGVTVFYDTIHIGVWLWRETPIMSRKRFDVDSPSLLLFTKALRSCWVRRGRVFHHQRSCTREMKNESP